jgi:uncharacterized membrane protein YphA (DoxX/SURF4 family)
MKKVNVFYWIFTALFGLMMIGSAIPDIASSAEAVEGFGKMNLPNYLLPFLGVAKVLGVIAILVPGHARIKEWAYAGLTFDLVGATYSIAASQPASPWIFMAIPLLLCALSYAFYRKRQALKTSTLRTYSMNNVPLKATAI